MLSQLELDASKKHATFADLMVAEVWLPILLAGEAKLPVLKNVGEQMVSLIVTDLELELADQVVTILFDLVSAVRGILAMASLE